MEIKPLIYAASHFCAKIEGGKGLHNVWPAVNAKKRVKEINASHARDELSPNHRRSHTTNVYYNS